MNTSPDSIDYRGLLQQAMADDDRSLASVPNQHKVVMTLQADGPDELCLAKHKSDPGRLCTRRLADCKVSGHAEQRKSGNRRVAGVYPVAVDPRTGDVKFAFLPDGPVPSPEDARKQALRDERLDASLSLQVLFDEEEDDLGFAGDDGDQKPPSIVYAKTPMVSSRHVSATAATAKAANVRSGLAGVEDDTTDGGGSAVPAELRALVGSLKSELTDHVRSTLAAAAPAPPPVDLKALVAEVTASVVQELNLSAPPAPTASTHLRNPCAAVGQAQRDLGEDLLYACPRSIEGPRLAKSFQEMSRVTRDARGCAHLVRPFPVSQLEDAEEWLQSEVAKQPSSGRGLPVQSYYGVGRGHKTGVTTDSDEARAWVDGFSNGRWKRFKSYEDAQRFVDSFETEREEDAARQSRQLAAAAALQKQQLEQAQLQIGVDVSVGKGDNYAWGHNITEANETNRLLGLVEVDDATNAKLVGKLTDVTGMPALRLGGGIGTDGQQDAVKAEIEV